MRALLARFTLPAFFYKVLLIFPRNYSFRWRRIKLYPILGSDLIANTFINILMDSMYWIPIRIGIALKRSFTIWENK
ncbi:hypothetical protein YA12_03920 [Klebsiella aerogenes]|nr:hypothetical protein YA12_03920 [Klebsiella aerogenes]KZQ56414.1 hypothetical protein A3N61_16230 [Klebsiella aerogenes]